jgi:tRNA-binding EMAP/Myf-like protein
MKLIVKENSKNYVCTVVEIKNVFPIEGADKIQRCVVNGNDVVVSKDVQVGDKMLYFVSGTRLSEEYCKYNNLLDKAEDNIDTTKKGFISHKQFRVKAIKLRGIVSDGMLMPLLSLAPVLGVGKNLEKLKVGDEFTDIDGISICEKYFVPSRNSNPGGKAPTKQPKISRLVENQFFLHNDTDNLRKNIHKLNLNDIVGIHYKKHGTSAVYGNVLVKKNLKWHEKLAKKLGVNIVDTEYDLVYSSRKVVKNSYLNPNQDGGFYGEDIWGTVAKEIKDLIPKNWTLYGEIVGYTPNGAAIQSMGGKDFDYGCERGKYKFYVYKISVVNPDGNVVYLTDKQIEDYCEKVGLLYKDTFIYYGTVGGIFEIKEYMDWDVLGRDQTYDTWREDLLAFLEYKHNEKDCYMCVNKVPEEGIILRVEKTFEYEAYKLKSKRFILGESDAQEKGEENLEDNQ